MNSRILDVLRDGIYDDFAIACHGVHLHFLGMFDELAHDDRVFLGDIGCKSEEALEFFLVAAHVHGCT